MMKMILRRNGAAVSIAPLMLKREEGDIIGSLDPAESRAVGAVGRAGGGGVDLHTAV